MFLCHRTDFEADLWPETGDFYLGLNKVTYLSICIGNVPNEMYITWVNAHNDI